MSGATAAYLAVVANAVKASGTVVRVDASEFERILSLGDRPLVVKSTGGVFSTAHKYLTSYRGLAFYCKSATELALPGDTELIRANKISIPDL